MDYIERHAHGQVCDALDSFRAVVLHGARQCGKSTLAQAVAAERGGTYATLDNPAVLAAALEDPQTFLLNQPHPLVIDEIQLGGDLLVRAVKVAVDDSSERGRFLLTGSTNFLTVPTISETLAGRIAILQLWPLSQSELAGQWAPRGSDRDLSSSRNDMAADGSAVAAWFRGEFRLGPSAGTTRDDYLRRPVPRRLPRAARAGGATAAALVRQLRDHGAQPRHRCTGVAAGDACDGPLDPPGPQRAPLPR